MDAYDYCRYLAQKIPNRWTGSAGEKHAGYWVEAQLARMGYETCQVRFECPAWEYGGEELFLGDEEIQAGAQFFSPACDVRGRLAAITPDRQGGFKGQAFGRIALLREDHTNSVGDRNALLAKLQEARAVAAIIVDNHRETYSTKLFRTPETRIPSVAVSGANGERLYAGLDKQVRLTIRAKVDKGETANVIGERGPADGPVIMVSAHHESAPNSPGALDDASGVGVVLGIAQAFAKEKLKARLRFCTFGGHEFGIFGSKMYVSRCADELKRFRRMLNFDCAGAKGTKPTLIVYGSKELTNRMQGLAAKLGSMEVAEEAGPPMGDNVPFVEAGMESAWLASGNAWEKCPIHTPDDDMRWVDRDELQRYVEMGTEIVREWMKE